MPRPTRSRNVHVAGRRTSLRLEEPFWAAADELCRRERQTLSQFCSAIAAATTPANLSAAVRLAIIGYFRGAASEAGGARAAHGGRPRAEAGAADPSDTRSDDLPA